MPPAARRMLATKSKPKPRFSEEDRKKARERLKRLKQEAHDAKLAAESSSTRTSATTATMTIVGRIRVPLAQGSQQNPVGGGRPPRPRPTGGVPSRR